MNRLTKSFSPTNEKMRKLYFIENFEEKLGIEMLDIQSAMFEGVNVKMMIVGKDVYESCPVVNVNKIGVNAVVKGRIVLLPFKEFGRQWFLKDEKK